MCIYIITRVLIIWYYCLDKAVLNGFLLLMAACGGWLFCEFYGGRAAGRSRHLHFHVSIVRLTSKKSVRICNFVCVPSCSTAHDSFPIWIAVVALVLHVMLKIIIDEIN